MAWFDMPLEKLEVYRTPDEEPSDFGSFWEETLADAQRLSKPPVFEKVTDSGLKLVDVYDVTFSGYSGQAIKGWFLEPAGNTEELPTVIRYIGYGGGRGLPLEHLDVVAAGFCYFVMDSRGQGASSSIGQTPDKGPLPPQFAGVMTRGIERKEDYYYRRLFTDAAMAVKCARLHSHVDADRIAVAGISQGGGLAIGAAALCAGQVKLLMADVPFLCNFSRAITIVDTLPYSEIALYLKSQRGRVAEVYETLSYFDGVHFAKRVTCRSLFSAALMDTICPPSTVFAAYNEIGAEKDIRVYPFNNHEGGGADQALERLRLAQQFL